MSEASEFMLVTPESVASDPDAVELIRIWWSKGEPVMSVKPAFDDPMKFGELLAVAARHMAHGYAVRHGHDERQAYHRILHGISEMVKADNIRTDAEPLTRTGGNA